MDCGRYRKSRRLYCTESGLYYNEYKVLVRIENTRKEAADEDVCCLFLGVMVCGIIKEKLWIIIKRSILDPARSLKDTMERYQFF